MKHLALTPILFSILLSFQNSFSQTPSRPNILLVIVDDGRYADYPSTGGPSWFNSPNINRIANEGANFKNSFVVLSMCEPSRVSILTGQYPHHNGFTSNKQEYDTSTLTIARILKDNGYYTGIVGKFVNSFVFPTNDFNYYFAYDGGGYGPQTFSYNGKDTLVPKNASQAINEFVPDFFKNAPTNSPFFLMYDPYAPHPPYKAYPGYKNEYHNQTVPLPSNFGGYTKNYPSYLYTDNNYNKDSAACVDDIQTYYETLIAAEVGLDTIFNILESKNILDSTLIIFMSDNGVFIGEHFFKKKRLAYEESIHIPLFVRYPKWFAPNTTIDNQFALNIDIFPTILEAAGITDTFNDDGFSLHALANNSKQRNLFMYEYFNDTTAKDVPDIRAVRDHNYKYIRSACDEETEEFYDLGNDIKEDSNQIFNPIYQTLIQHYREVLDSMRLVLGDNPANDSVFNCSLINIDSNYALTPLADFSASSSNICSGSSINFTDLSLGSPTTWTWSFTGGSPATSNLKNPTGITYSTAGSYAVSLTAANALGSDVEIKNGYINVSVAPTSGQASVTADGPVSFCGNKGVTLSVAAAGLTYQWTKDGNNLDGETNQSYLAKKTATFACKVSNSCSTTTSNSIGVIKNTKPTSDVSQAPCSGGSVLLTCTPTPTTGITFKWKKGSSTISGATNATYTATSTATYKCMVTITATGCTKNSLGSYVTINCKTSELNEESQIKIYPNPSSNYFVISASGEETNSVVKIYDLTGKLLEQYEMNGKEIHAGAILPSGMYFAKIITNSEVKQVIKLVKE